MDNKLTEKKYLLKGLDCANCAAKIENAVKKADGISSASVNILNNTLIVKIEDDYAKNIKKRIEEIVHKYESDVTVVEQNDIPHDHEDSGKHDLIKLIVGAGIFAVGLIISILTELNQYIYLCALG